MVLSISQFFVKFILVTKSHIDESPRILNRSWGATYNTRSYDPGRGGGSGGGGVVTFAFSQTFHASSVRLSLLHSFVGYSFIFFRPERSGSAHDTRRPPDSPRFVASSLPESEDRCSDDDDRFAPAARARARLLVCRCRRRPPAVRVERRRTCTNSVS